MEQLKADDEMEQLKADEMERGMLVAELQRAITYTLLGTAQVEEISKVLTKWTQANPEGRREIYSKWRNS